MTTTLTATGLAQHREGDAGWHRVCSVNWLLPERGVAGLVGEIQVAVFRTFGGEFYAIGNIDPFSSSAVLSRGIVGTRGVEPTVASPLHKQVFSLSSGQCLDVPGVSVPVFPVRINQEEIEVFIR